jgi:hypothetical protein
VVAAAEAVAEATGMSTYTRFEDWPNRLAHLIASRKASPFVWGSNDCMMWGAECIIAQAGVDTLKAYRGVYSSPGGAAKALRQIGSHKRTEGLMDEIWGPRRHISRARLGDIVAADFGDRLGFSAGLCYGRRSLFVGTIAGKPGLVTLDTRNLEHSYQPWALS